MIKPHDEARIRKAVRTAIERVLQEDLDGNEMIMKEVWEDCGSMDEERVAKDELSQIIRLIKTRT